MKTFWFNLFLTAFICAVPGPASAMGECAACKSVSLDIISAANDNGVQSVCLTGYTGEDGVEKSETDYVTELMRAYLSGWSRPALIERSGNDENPAAGGLSRCALVTGKVRADGNKLQILTQLIDLRRSSPLLEREAEMEREQPRSPEEADTPIYWISHDFDAPAPASDFRDAPADAVPDSCAARQSRLNRLNSKLVDVKAFYWASVMKAPGFKLRSLTMKPGSEMADPAVKDRFFKVMASYYFTSGSGPRPGPEQLSALTDLLKAERLFRKECGYR